MYIEWTTTAFTHFVTLHGAYSNEYVVCKSILYDSMARLAALWLGILTKQIRLDNMINPNGLYGHVPLPVPLRLVGSGFDPVYLA